MNTTETTEQIQRIQSGDKDAFKQVIEDHKRLVAHIVFRLVNNTTDREDLCQEVFIKVYQNIAKFRHQCKLSTWIGKIAYNTSLNYLQKKRALLFEDITQEQSIDSVKGYQSTPHELMESSDISHKLQMEINQLSDTFRTIITLYHLQEMSYKEIGQIMDLPEGTVKSYLFRARRQLRKNWELKYQEDKSCVANM